MDPRAIRPKRPWHCYVLIHMPLVRTPMIAPSHRLNPVPAISPERAAAMVVRRLVEKPGAHRYPAGHARRSRHLLRAEDVAPNSASALPGLPGFGRGARTAFRPGDGSAVETEAEAPGPCRRRGYPDAPTGQTPGAAGARGALVKA